LRPNSFATSSPAIMALLVNAHGKINQLRTVVIAEGRPVGEARDHSTWVRARYCVAWCREPANNTVSLYRLNALRGAAFVLVSEPAELWLVDLSGHARELPAKVYTLGSVQQLQCGTGSARWSRVRIPRRIGAYAIARVSVQTTEVQRVAAIARAWCLDGALP